MITKAWWLVVTVPITITAVSPLCFHRFFGKSLLQGAHHRGTRTAATCSAFMIYGVLRKDAVNQEILQTGTSPKKQFPMPPL